MSNDNNAPEIEVYVCWEYEDSKGRAIKTPTLLRSDADSPSFYIDLLDFDVHPMRAEILALADLAGRDEGEVDWKLGDDGRSRFSNNFFLPAEWFDGCAWEE